MSLSVRYDHSLLAHNTFGIDVRADCFIEYHSEDELREALKMLREHSCPRILNIGRGSNLLFCSDFEGAVLRNAITTMEVTDRSWMEDVYVRVGGGCCWDSFVALAVRSGWYGAENLSGIPGDAGASAVQNIGAYGAEVKDLIDKVEAIDAETGAKREFTVGECLYTYRGSIFKRPEYKKYIITYVTYHLSTVFRPNLSYKALQQKFGGLKYEGWRPRYGATDIRRAVVEMRNTKLPDPARLGNAGSFFMNPVVSCGDFERLRAEWPDIPHFAAESAADGDAVKLSAAWLIDHAGMKGYSRGAAAVYEKQPLVLVNIGGATGADILALAREVIDAVRDKFAVELKMEVNAI